MARSGTQWHAVAQCVSKKETNECRKRCELAVCAAVCGEHPSEVKCAGLAKPPPLHAVHAAGLPTQRFIEQNTRPLSTQLLAAKLVPVQMEGCHTSPAPPWRRPCIIRARLHAQNVENTDRDLRSFARQNLGPDQRCLTGLKHVRSLACTLRPCGCSTRAGCV